MGQSAGVEGRVPHCLADFDRIDRITVTDLFPVPGRMVRAVPGSCSSRCRRATDGGCRAETGWWM